MDANQFDENNFKRNYSFNEHKTLTRKMLSVMLFFDALLWAILLTTFNTLNEFTYPLAIMAFVVSLLTGDKVKQYDIFRTSPLLASILVATSNVAKAYFIVSIAYLVPYIGSALGAGMVGAIYVGLLKGIQPSITRTRLATVVFFGSILFCLWLTDITFGLLWVMWYSYMTIEGAENLERRLKPYFEKGSSLHVDNADYLTYLYEHAIAIKGSSKN